MYLLTVKQRSNETLKEFVDRFNLVRMEVEDPPDYMVIDALYAGISAEGPLMKELVLKNSWTLQDFMDKVYEFINEEEFLKAMASSRRHQEKRKRIE
jgi:hypothetical protein